MALAWLALVPLALFAGAGALGRRGWPFELILSVAPQQALACAAYALAMFALGLPLQALCAMALAALNIFTARELLARPTPPLAARTLRIVWANVWLKPEAFAAAIGLAEREGADALAIAEYPTHLPAASRRAIARAFPFEAGAMADKTINVALFARRALQEAAPIAIAALPERRGLAATLDGVRLIAIHPKVPYTARMNAERDAMIEAAFAAARAAGGAALIVGDFNTTSWSPVLRKARIGAAANIWGLRSTWATRWPFLGLPIDHAFGFGGLRVSAVLGPRNSSDHLPAVVDVLRTPAADR